MFGKTQAGHSFRDLIKEELLSNQSKRGGKAQFCGFVDLQQFAKVCFKYDPCSLIHGVFLEKVAGRLRFPRALSAFIEASAVRRVESGGVKLDRTLPKPGVAGVDAKLGYGNVPFYRTEFTAKSITAFFAVDVAQIRGYGLPLEANALLIALALWKIRKFLDSSMRLRSACEFELHDSGLTVKAPAGFTLPGSGPLRLEIKDLMKKCQPHFAQPAVTELLWTSESAGPEKLSKRKRDIATEE